MRLLLLSLTASPCWAGEAWPKVVMLSQVRSDVTELVIQTGTVVYSRQQALSEVLQPGDEIVGGKELRRGGKAIGVLVGKDKDIFFGYDRVVESPFKAEQVMQHTAIALSSPDDPKFAQGQTPSSVHRKTKPFEVARVGPWEFEAPLQHHYFITWRQALEPGKRYRLELPIEALGTIEFTPDPRSQRSEAVHVSQLGFRPGDSPKRAFLSCWTGSGGGLDYPEGLDFELIDHDSKQIVYRGKLALHRSAEQLDHSAQNSHTHADVWEADFSAFQLPGTYHVSIAGVGCSYPFRIAEDVWLKAFAISAKGFYAHRRSVEIGPPYSDYQRPLALHPSMKEILLTKATLMETNNGLNRSDPNNFVRIQAKASEEAAGDWAWGGLMDAGDWDSRIQHLKVTRYLLDLLDHNPQTFDTLELNLPETGNHLPDIMDEALFNLDHYRRMQTPDGGIRGGIESEKHPLFGEGSWQESLKVYAYAPDAWSSFLYAASAAEAARIAQRYDPSLSETYEASALSAMHWAERAYAAESSWPPLVNDARNHAAASLLRLTGDPAWNRLFLQTTALGSDDDELYAWGRRDQIEAAWQYAQCDRSVVDATVQAKCRSALIKDAEHYVEASRSSAFRISRRIGDSHGYGSFVTPEGGALIRAHILSGDIRYLETLLDLTQAGTGANPVNTCYTLGVGERNPRRVLHEDSYVTGQAPPPGITILGPLNPIKWRNLHSTKLVAPYVYPKIEDWPSIEAHWEMNWFSAINEYVVHGPMIETAYAWGYLAAQP